MTALTMSDPGAQSTIEVISHRTVQPARQRVLFDKPTYDLGPLDHFVAAGIPVAAIFIYPSNTSSTSSSSETFSAAMLERALAIVLDYYPFLSGRLQPQPNGSYGISHRAAGSSFLQARCSHSLASYRPSTGNLTLAHLPDGGNALMAPFDPGNISSEPVLSIQHTRFACGGAALGVRILHKVVDAEGYFMFVRHLIGVYRQLRRGEQGVIDDPPLLAPYTGRTTASSPPAAADGTTIDPPGYTTTPGTNTSTGFTSPMTVTGRFLHISQSALTQLKHSAQPPSPTSTSSPTQTQISSFVALTSFLYQRTHRARLLIRSRDDSIPDLSPTEYLTSVNIRHLLALDGQSYPHNALLTPHTLIPPSTLSQSPLHAIATHIHNMIQTARDAEAAEETVKWISEQPDKTLIRSTFQYGPGAFMTSAWNRIDMYGDGFVMDNIRPELVSTPFTPISLVDGLGYFLPSRDEDGLDVCLALDERVWEVLEGDEEWGKVFGRGAEV